MSVQARFRGRCVRCGAHYEIGEEITNIGGDWVHDECMPAEDDS